MKVNGLIKLKQQKDSKKLIDILQCNISDLHYIHINCQELYREVDADNFIKLNEKVYEGNIKKSIVKSILEYYKN